MARYLVGRLVARRLAVPGGEALLLGRIVETEAYLTGDAACHAFRGMTPRNRSLFLEHGHAYVYLAYGTAWMLNVSAGPVGIGTGVLIRALQPTAGLEIMRARRGRVPDRDLARGPGRLAAALAIDRALDGVDLCHPGPLWLGDDGGDGAPSEIGTSTRIGLTRDADRMLRFFRRGSAWLSGPARLNRPDG